MRNSRRERRLAREAEAGERGTRRRWRCRGAGEAAPPGAGAPRAAARVGVGGRRSTAEAAGWRPRMRAGPRFGAGEGVYAQRSAAAAASSRGRQPKTNQTPFSFHNPRGVPCAPGNLLRARRGGGAFSGPGLPGPSRPSQPNIA